MAVTENSDVVVPFVAPGGDQPSGTSPTSTVEELFGLDAITPPATAPGSAPRSFSKRWKHEALFEDGYVGVPAGFLQLYAQLNPPLTPGEAVFVIHVMQFKWDEKAPFPSYKTIAQQMGVTDKMTRRHAQSLDTKKYLRRVQRIGSTNRFDLTPLFDALVELQQRRKSTTKAG